MVFLGPAELTFPAVFDSSELSIRILGIRALETKLPQAYDLGSSW